MTGLEATIDPVPCDACGSARRSALPTPGSSSMLSDGRVLARPLAKIDCLDCGLVTHARPLGASEVTGYFRDGYSLYSHPPGRAVEKARQEAYADWIVSSIETREVKDVLEAGCGNGSMLLELRRFLPSARLHGLEPSEEAAREARAAGIAVWAGFVEDLARDNEGQDLVLSVNVIEHSANPVRFLGCLAAMAKPGGQIVVVCPDGMRPSSELLIFDHLFSLTPSALTRFARRSGLEVQLSRSAPAALGPFRLHVLSRTTEEATAPLPIPPTLHAARAAYLQAWSDLGPKLVARIEGARSITCFGAGETALLLRAYAPQVWGRVHRIALDEPTGQTFCGLPVEALDRLEIRPEEVALLAVRPQDQRTLAERLAPRWPRVVRWDDHVAS